MNTSISGAPSQKVTKPCQQGPQGEQGEFSVGRFAAGASNPPRSLMNIKIDPAEFNDPTSVQHHPNTDDNPPEPFRWKNLETYLDTKGIIPTLSRSNELAVKIHRAFKNAKIWKLTPKEIGSLPERARELIQGSLNQENVNKRLDDQALAKLAPHFARFVSDQTLGETCVKGLEGIAKHLSIERCHDDMNFIRLVILNHALGWAPNSDICKEAVRDRTSPEILRRVGDGQVVGNQALTMSLRTLIKIQAYETTPDTNAPLFLIKTILSRNDLETWPIETLMSLVESLSLMPWDKEEHCLQLSKKIAEQIIPRRAKPLGEMAANVEDRGVTLTGVIFSLMKLSPKYPGIQGLIIKHLIPEVIHQMRQHGQEFSLKAMSTLFWPLKDLCTSKENQAAITTFLEAVNEVLDDDGHRLNDLNDSKGPRDPNDKFVELTSAFQYIAAIITGKDNCQSWSQKEWFTTLLGKFAKNAMKRKEKYPHGDLMRLISTFGNHPDIPLCAEAVMILVTTWNKTQLEPSTLIQNMSKVLYSLIGILHHPKYGSDTKNLLTNVLNKLLDLDKNEFSYLKPGGELNKHISALSLALRYQDDETQEKGINLLNSHPKFLLSVVGHLKKQMTTLFQMKDHQRKKIENKLRDVNWTLEALRLSPEHDHAKSIRREIISHLALWATSLNNFGINNFETDKPELKALIAREKANGTFRRENFEKKTQ